MVQRGRHAARTTRILHDMLSTLRDGLRTCAASLPLPRSLNQSRKEEDRTQLRGQSTGGQIRCRCPLLKASTPVDQTMSAAFSLAAVAVAIVHGGGSLCYLVSSCEQLLLEDWYRLAAHLRIPQTMLGCRLTHTTTAGFNFVD